jgi:hypothetical protein
MFAPITQDPEIKTQVVPQFDFHRLMKVLTH